MENCYHCGDDVVKEYKEDGHTFCCNGCLTVYGIINNAGLQAYYSENNKPGINNSKNIYLDYLSAPEIEESILTYKDDGRSVVKFVLPSIHCASCVWLLERLNLLSKGILSSQVNFLSKKITIHFSHSEISLKEVGELLLSIGYEPKLDFSKKKKRINHLVIRIGVMGFCFGNIMLLSFPEYFGSVVETNWSSFFSLINIALSIPVVTYGAQPFYKGVWSALKAKKVSVDVLIVIGVLALFGRSLYEILFLEQGGYLDSLSGLIFFLLIGKWFQAKVFSELSFEKENSTYLPLAVLKETESEFVITPLKDLNKGDVIRLRNGEVVPFKCVLKSIKGTVDNSFITGEELPVQIKSGDVLFCGAQVQGEYIEAVVSDVSTMNLSELWRENAQDVEQKQEVTVNTNLITGFTFSVLTTAIITFIYWSNHSLEKAFLAATSVLIIACPCALALSAPTVYGLILRMLGRKGLFLKSATIIKKLGSIQTLVFDKTGTVTGKEVEMKWNGESLSDSDQAVIASIVKNSSHPLAGEILKQVKGKAEIDNYQEVIGEGVVANSFNSEFKIGTADFVGVAGSEGAMSVYVSKNNALLGRYSMRLSIRENLDSLFEQLNQEFKSYLLSGDPNLNKADYNQLFTESGAIISGASPEEKKSFITNLNSKTNVMMLGDGINDSLAFNEASVGIAVVEETGSFFPSCDGIVKADGLSGIKEFIQFSKFGKIVLGSCFLFSFTYNVIGVYYAVTLNLSPLFAAILMPLSSISVVVLAYLMLTIRGVRS